MKHCSINQILNAKSAGDIFSADPNIMKTEYRNYAKAYHPDVCHREDVMTAVNTLFAQAKKMLENKDWEQTNVLFFSDTTLNKRYSLHYNQMYKFEYGYYYVGDYTLIYMFKEEKPILKLLKISSMLIVRLNLILDSLCLILSKWVNVIRDGMLLLIKTRMYILFQRYYVTLMAR